MKKGYIKILIVSIILILLLSLNSILDILNIYTFILFLFITMIIIFYYLGYEKNNHRFQKDVMLNILIYSVVYIIITNISGLFIGFNKTGYNLRVISILENIIPVILIITMTEIIRYIFITKCSLYKTIYLLLMIVFILFDITLSINRYNLQILDELVNVIISIILPSISKNIMLNYLTLKVGYKPAILYRFIFELPIYFFPIFPDFGMYIESILKIVSPAILMYMIHYSFEKIRNKEVIIKKTKFNYETINLIVFSIIILMIVSLSSGWFKYYFLTIGSESMTGSINKGDIIIVKKLNDNEINNLKEGDILVFQHSKKIIVHRIVRILVIQNNNYFYTKGDYNESEDGYPIEKKDIIGTTSFRMPYLGYPAVWLNELVRK